MSDTHPEFSQISARVTQLRAHAVEWKRENSDPCEFMPTFASEADSIVEDAEHLGGDAVESAHQLIDEILIDLG